MQQLPPSSQHALYHSPLTYQPHWPPILSSNTQSSSPLRDFANAVSSSEFFPMGHGVFPLSFCRSRLGLLFQEASLSLPHKTGPLPTLTPHHMHCLFPARHLSHSEIIFLIYFSGLSSICPLTHIKNFLLDLCFQFIQVAEHLEIMLFFVEYHEHLISYLILSYTLGENTLCCMDACKISTISIHAPMKTRYWTRHDQMFEFFCEYLFVSYAFTLSSTSTH